MRNSMSLIFIGLAASVLMVALVGCGDDSSSASSGSYIQEEETPTLCQNGIDDDEDGKIDCDDDGCKGFLFCAYESPTEDNAITCQDGLDNDGDNKVDCEDEDCMGFVFCVNDNPQEDTAALCQDGEDNDGDGATDCDDPDCQGFVFCVPPTEDTATLCQDGEDNDNDGATDCDDPDCRGFVFCQPQLENTTATCTDGTDNDGDGFADCDDPDCSGFSFCQPPTEDTSVACQDGTDNDGDGQVDCDDPDCVGFYFCQGQAEDTPSTCSNGIDDDGDGDVDCDDEDCWYLVMCGHYNGYPVKDPWGAMWDGIERGAQTYEAAKAACEALGGRLPTITELYRNRASAGGSGALGTNINTNYLWTLIPAHNPDSTALVRVSDGDVNYSSSGQSYPFRCIWPEREHNGFDEVACYGEPGSTCWSSDIWNVDSLDRPAVTYATAVNECAFYNGSVPVIADWGNIIQEGLPNPSDQWLWAGNAMYWYNGNYGHALIKWNQSNAKTWSYHYSATGAITNPTTERRFRCIGLIPGAPVTPPSNPQCTVNCFTNDSRRSTMITEVADRSVKNLIEALDTCVSLGGDIANVSEWTEFIHEGLYVDTSWHWALESMYWYSGNYGYPIIRDSSRGTAWAYYNGYSTSTLSTSSSTRPYRCVWRTRRPSIPACDPQTEVAKWHADQDAYVCETATDGTSNGNANGGEVVDPWGNVWDGTERSAATYETALSLCESLGGRLPTATEVWAVRASGNMIPSIGVGSSSNTNYLWTMTVGYNDGSHTVVRISDGGSTYTYDTNSYAFRCIWPSSRSDVLATRNCYAKPDEGCYRTSTGLYADRYDRIAITLPAAVHECRMAGGRLPTQREVIKLIHSGWGNGTNSWLWLNESMYWYSNHYGYALYRWSGAGTNAWSYISGNASVAGASGVYKFRCVYDETIR